MQPRRSRIGRRGDGRGPRAGRLGQLVHVHTCVAFLCLALGVALSCVLFDVLDNTLHKTRDRQMTLISRGVSHHVDMALGSALSSLSFTAGLFSRLQAHTSAEPTSFPHAGLSPVSAAAFTEIATLFASQQSEVSAFGWIPHVRSDDERELWVSATGQAYPELGAVNFTNSDGAEPLGNAPYFPVGFLYPMDPGFVLLDFNSDPLRREELLQAARLGGSVVGGAVSSQLNNNDLTVCAVHPVLRNRTRGATALDDDNVMGFTVWGFRVERLLTKLLQPLLKVHPELWLSVTDEDGTLLFVGGRGAVSRAETPIDDHGRPKPPTLAFGAGSRISVPIRAAQRTWTLEIVEVQPLLSASEIMQPYIALGAGVALSVVLAAVLWLWGTRSRSRAAWLLKMVNAMRDFTAMATHDLRTPVKALAVLLEELRGSPLTDAQRELVDDSVVCQHVMQHIIENVITHEKLASGQAAKLLPAIAHVDVADVVARVVKVTRVYHLKEDVVVRQRLVRVTDGGLFARGDHRPKDLAGLLDGDDDLDGDGKVQPLEHLHVHTDERWVQQMLMNFVSNALKFTAAGSVEALVVLVDGSARGERSWLRLEVHDTGKGVSDEQARRLFQRFSQLQSNKGGLGLGLFTVNALCRTLGGECGVCPRLDGGQGSVFWAAFPVALCDDSCALHSQPLPPASRHAVGPSSGAQGKGEGEGEVGGEGEKGEEEEEGDWDTPQPASQPDRPLAPAPRRPRCLVADDVGVNLKLAKAVLRTMGVDAVCVSSGAKAVEELADPVRRAAFAFALIDVHMPDLSGMDVARAVRARERQERRDARRAGPNSAHQGEGRGRGLIVRGQGEQQGAVGEEERGDGRLLVIALTAGTESENECLEAGMDAVLPKPLQPDGLRAVLERLDYNRRST